MIGRDLLRVPRLAWVFFRIGAMNELQYRLNFFIYVFQAMLTLGTGLVVLALVFSYTTDLGGWSRPELLAVMGVHILMGGMIRSAIQPNMVKLMEDVRQGTLDYALTKPEDAQLLVSVRESRIWQAVDILVGAIVLVVAVVQLEGGIGAWEALAFAAALILGGVTIYCFWLILTTLAFWVVRIHETVELFEGVYQAGRWPVTVYPFALRVLLTFLIPLAVAITVPAQGITSRLNWQTLALAVAFTALLVMVTRWLWKLGLRRYSGASA
ncbi:MAG TPA: ABC-2 family transporter protein [Actinomycetota bacterium]|jgi:ABC-2 type transport system permease protein|nr:ABC-2 family transporter protein [Actinomycetota bacterium]